MVIMTMAIVANFGGACLTHIMTANSPPMETLRCFSQCSPQGDPYWTRPIVYWCDFSLFYFICTMVTSFSLFFLLCSSSTMIAAFADIHCTSFLSFFSQRTSHSSLMLFISNICCGKYCFSLYIAQAHHTMQTKTLMPPKISMLLNNISWLYSWIQLFTYTQVPHPYILHVNMTDMPFSMVIQGIRGFAAFWFQDFFFRHTYSHTHITCLIKLKWRTMIDVNNNSNKVGHCCGLTVCSILPSLIKINHDANSKFSSNTCSQQLLFCNSTGQPGFTHCVFLGTFD